MDFLSLSLGLGNERIFGGEGQAFRNNQVQFDGNNDLLRRGANVFATDPKSVVIYADLTTPEKVDTNNFICGSSVLLMAFNNAPVGLTFTHSSGTVSHSAESPPLLPSTRYRLALSMQCDTVDAAADGVCKLWLSADGGAWTLASSSPPNSLGDSTTMGLSPATNFTVLGNPQLSTQSWGKVADATKIDGAPVGFFGLWASTSRTGAILTDPSIFFPGGHDRNLAADLTVGGVLPQPLVAFGGTQVAADWNAGTNLGTAGNFTMFGGV